jgi:hypothetical protein
VARAEARSAVDSYAADKGTTERRTHYSYGNREG